MRPLRPSSSGSVALTRFDKHEYANAYRSRCSLFKVGAVGLRRRRQSRSGSIRPLTALTIAGCKVVIRNAGNAPELGLRSLCLKQSHSQMRG